MTRTKKFLQNTLTTALLQVLTFLVGLLTPRIMLSVYGSETNGLISSVNQFITYFCLVEAGLSGSIVYALYKPLSEQNTQAINTILSTGNRYYKRATGFLFLMLTILILLYPLFLTSQSVSPIEMCLLILLLAVDNLTMNFFFVNYRLFLTANQKSYIISLSSMAQLLTHLCIVLTFATPQVSITQFLILAQCPLLLRSTLMYLYCKKNYPYLNLKTPPQDSCLSKRKDARYHQILAEINTGAPIILLTLVTQDLKLVSLYSIFNIVITGLNGFLGIFTTVLPATFGDLISRKEHNTLQKVHNEFEFIFYGILSLVYGITLVTLMPFIRIYTEHITDTNYDLPLFGYLFVFSSLFSMISIPQGILITCAGHYKETRKQVTLQSSILVTVSLISMEFVGVYGVLIGTLSSAVYLCFAWLSYAPKHITHAPLAPSLHRILRIFCTLFFISTPFFFLNYSPTGFFSWILYASTVGIYGIFVVVSFNYICEKEEIHRILHRLKDVLKK